MQGARQTAHGGNSGVWELGLRRWESAALSVLYDPNVQEAIMMGFYSFYRAEARVRDEGKPRLTHLEVKRRYGIR